MSITRYEIDVFDRLVTEPDGDLVSYDDHSAEVERLTAALRRISEMTYYKLITDMTRVELLAHAIHEIARAALAAGEEGT